MQKNGSEVDKESFDYIVNREAGSSNVVSAHGYKRDCDRDGHVLPERQIDDPAAPGGRRGMRINDFANLEIAKECKLTKAEVIALRFYTTSGFKTINNALRDRDRLQRGETHPLPIMVWLLQNAVKKMRTQAANSDTCMQKLDLYRGMSNVVFESDFMSKGGTELAPMSTTKDLAMAIEFSSEGARSVLLRVRTTGFMNRGAQLGWLSVFPFEVEYLYPPATFLKPLRAKPYDFQIEKRNGSEKKIFQVVDVEPQLS